MRPTVPIPCMCLCICMLSTVCLLWPPYPLSAILGRALTFGGKGPKGANDGSPDRDDRAPPWPSCTLPARMGSGLNSTGSVPLGEQGAHGLPGQRGRGPQGQACWCAKGAGKGTNSIRNKPPQTTITTCPPTARPSSRRRQTPARPHPCASSPGSAIEPNPRFPICIKTSPCQPPTMSP